MLLIIRGAGDAGNNSKHCAKPIISAVNRVGHPTAAASVPTFTLEDLIQRSARVNGGRHRAEHPSMSFFFNRTFSQKLLNVLLARERTLGLIAKFCFLPFFCRFHTPNRDLCSGDFVPPAI